MKWAIWQTLEFVLIISSVKSSIPSPLILTRKNQKAVAEQRYKLFCSCSFCISDIHSSDFYYIRSFISKMCTRIDPLVQLAFQAPKYKSSWFLLFHNVPSKSIYSFVLPHKEVPLGLQRRRSRKKEKGQKRDIP